MSLWDRMKYRKKRQQTPSLRTLMPKQQGQGVENNGKLTGSIEDTIAVIEQSLGESDDFIIRRFHVFGYIPAAVLFLSDLGKEETIGRDILKPLMYVPRHLAGKNIKSNQLKSVLLNETLFKSEVQLERRISKLVEFILFGRKVIVVQGLDEAFVTGARSVAKRSVNQPETEQVIRGPREGFVEPLDTNLSMIRYRLPISNYRVKFRQIGRLTKSRAAVCYIEGIANPALVQEVNDRLGAIDLDGVLDSGYLEQFIEDNNLSPFPQIQNTERPDKAVANLLEGRVVILLDGSPFALIVPAVFSQFYQSVDDYSERFVLSSFVRLARLVALLFSLIFPSLYVSVISYNPELIPTEFAVAVAGGRAGVPFPAVVEVLIMEISMEVLREATVRLPRQVGGALSIVGVLVIGTAAVSAGFASPITVVVIALTTIGSFATPAYNTALALRLLRFPLIFLAGIFGLYGVMVGLIIIVNHMLSLRSFGVPYLSPVVPGNWQGIKDTIARSAFWMMPKRPLDLHPPHSARLGRRSMEIKQPPSNTLDPVNVGNQRGDQANGNTSRDDSGPSNGDSH